MWITPLPALAGPKATGHMLLSIFLLFSFLAPSIHGNKAIESFVREEYQLFSLKNVKCSVYLPPRLKKNAVRMAPILPQPVAFKKYGRDQMKAWAKCSRYVLIKLFPLRGLKRLFPFARYNKHHLLHRLSWNRRSKKKGFPYAFEEGPPLGSGVFGKVLSGKWYPSPDKEAFSDNVAIKKLPKKGTKEMHPKRIALMFYREVLITIAAHSLAPRGVIRPVDIYLDDPDHWIIVMEKADGDVSHLLEDPDTLNKFHQAGAVAGRPIPEIIIREIYAQPIMAIYLMNKAHITHRDIKNENLLYSCSGGPCRVMIADFGFSTLTDAELMTEPFCGTPYVLPLCMLNGSYGNRNHRRTMDVYGIISSIHVAASYEGKLKASTPEKLTDSTTLVSKKEMSSKASVLEEKEKMSFLSTVVQKGKGVLRYWKGGAFVKRPISDELKAIFKAVLIQENWEPNPKTIGQLIPLLHSWAHAPLLGGPLLTSL